MSDLKQSIGIDVLTAAQNRIAFTFDHFDNICVSFSGGKDSTVMLHLVAEEARKRNRKIALLFVDLEAQYDLTIQHTLNCYELYADCVEPYWIALPLSLRNAVSQYQPQWLCWDPNAKDQWVRNPPSLAITEIDAFPFYRLGMEFEEFVPDFAAWLAGDQSTACFVGIRSDESLNRFRTIAAQRGSRFQDLSWTTWKGGSVYNVYPIYDWRTEDVWTYHAKYPKMPYNRLYDRMHQAGLTIHQARICQPYGDDQRKGLWLYHLIEPETWGRLIARVNGANSGALYSQESGNITGVRSVSLPPGHTWQSFAEMLLDTMPSNTAEHYRDKIAVFLKWWSDRGYPNGIPDFADPKQEASKEVPTWRRICKTLLRNDYWCKGLSFSQHKSEAYDRYRKIMKKRRALWGIY